MKLYKAYWLKRGGNPKGTVTLHGATEWFASLATRGLTAGTIRMYRSALSTHYVETTASITPVTAPHALAIPSPPNPLAEPIVKRLLDGIANTNAEGEQKKRDERPKTVGVSLGNIEGLLSSSPCDRDVMYIAAAAVAAAAGLRPSELLGSKTYTDRPLTLRQFEFFDGGESLNPKGVYDPQSVLRVPTHCLLRLLTSKTNQGRENVYTPISQPFALGIAWRWYNARCMRAASSPTTLMFHYHPETPLIMPQLIAYLADRLRLPDLTAKCFRIGAASSMAAAGFSVADIAANCRWTATSRMPLSVYADGAALRQRMIMINSRMR